MAIIRSITAHPSASSPIRLARANRPEDKPNNRIAEWRVTAVYRDTRDAIVIREASGHWALLGEVAVGHAAVVRKGGSDVPLTCPRVTAPFRRKRCPECGHKVRETYCDACGYDLIEQTRTKMMRER